MAERVFLPVDKRTLLVPTWTHHSPSHHHNRPPQNQIPANRHFMLLHLQHPALAAQRCSHTHLRAPDQRVACRTVIVLPADYHGLQCCIGRHYGPELRNLLQQISGKLAQNIAHRVHCSPFHAVTHCVFPDLQSAAVLSAFTISAGRPSHQTHECAQLQPL